MVDHVRLVAEDHWGATVKAIGVYLDAEKRSVNTEHPNFKECKERLMGRAQEKVKEEERYGLAVLDLEKSGVVESGLHLKEEVREQAKVFMDIVEVRQSLVSSVVIFFFSHLLLCLNLQAYMENVVRTNLSDLVPKMIVAHLLHETVKNYLGEKGEFVSKMVTVREFFWTTHIAN